MAKKSGDVRPKITLACTECKERNYITKKNRFFPNFIFQPVIKSFFFFRLFGNIVEEKFRS